MVGENYLASLPDRGGRIIVESVAGCSWTGWQNDRGIRTLKIAGYAVMEGVDGVDALAKLASQKVHLIICDVNMPNMDGISFVREVKKSDNYKFIPIIMLTTASQERKKMEGLAAGARAWIVKPFQPDQMLSAVSKLIMP